MEQIQNIKGIRCFQKRENATNNYSYLPVLIEDDYGITRDQLYDLLKEHDIFARKYFYPLTSDQACFKNKYRNVQLDNARELANRVLVLPLYEKLPFEAIDRIIKLIQENVQE